MPLGNGSGDTIHQNDEKSSGVRGATHFAAFYPVCEGHGDGGGFANPRVTTGFAEKKKAVARTAAFRLVAGDRIELPTFRL